MNKPGIFGTAVLWTVLAVSGLLGQATAAETFVLVPAEAAIRTSGENAMIHGDETMWAFRTEGEVGDYIQFPADGKYRFTVRACGTVVDDVWPRMVIYIDGVRVVGVGAVDSTEPKDFVYESEIVAGTHRIAVAFLNDAVEEDEEDPEIILADRDLFVEWMRIDPPAGGDAPMRGTQADYTKEGLAREAKVLKDAAEGIEKYRKADAVVRVVNADGQIVPNAEIRVEQVTHEFLFGCNIFRLNALATDELNAQYARRFEELFNYATIPFYWRGYRQGEGPNWDRTDPMVAWCTGRGIAMKGHPLLWGRPPYRRDRDIAAADEAARKQRVTDVMTRYKDRIKFWEVVNEPVHQPTITIDQPYRWARQIDPAANLIINEYYVMADTYPDFFKLLTKAVADGVPFDGVGIQAHEPRTMRFPLDQVVESLDLYATFGKEIHITEYSPPSAGQDIAGSPVIGKWDEAAQADYAEKFYRVCFAHPAVRAITWWDFCDGRTFIPGGGMLREDMSPKPVYEALKKLIHEEWRTRMDGRSDAEGKFTFRGFRGAYEVTVTANGKATTTRFELTGPQGEQPATYEVKLP